MSIYYRNDMQNMLNKLQNQQNRVQSLGTYSESKKYVATSLVVRHLLNILHNVQQY